MCNFLGGDQERRNNRREEIDNDEGGRQGGTASPEPAEPGAREHARTPR